MPRSYGSSTPLYVGHLSSRTRPRDLEHMFSRYGRTQFHAPPYITSYDGLTLSGNHFRRVRDVDMKRDYAFVEFSDPRDADDARYSLDGRDFDGHRIIVEFAKGTPRGPGGVRDREYAGRGPAPGSCVCFNCGIEGHWARDCKAGDWKNKCYRCGERGHIERKCPNSPKKLKRGQSYSRSPVRSRSPRPGRSRSRSFTRSRSYSRSRSPPARRVRDVDYKERRSVSPELKRGNSKPSPTPEKDSPRERANLSPRRGRMGKERERYNDSPNETSQSPRSKKRYGNRRLSPTYSPKYEMGHSLDDGGKRSPSPTYSPRHEVSPSLDGGKRSPTNSPRYEMSHSLDDDGKRRPSPTYSPRYEMGPSLGYGGKRSPIRTYSPRYEMSHSLDDGGKCSPSPMYSPRYEMIDDGGNRSPSPSGSESP